MMNKQVWAIVGIIIIVLFVVNQKEIKKTAMLIGNTGGVTNGYWVGTGSPITTAIGQTFTPTSTFTITNVKLYLDKGSSPTGTMTISIRATSSGLPTGVDLASTTYDVSTLPITAAVISFPISYTVTSGVQYALVLSYNGGGGGHVTFWAGSNAYTGGILVEYIGGNWYSSPTKDAYFEIWETTCTPQCTGKSCGDDGCGGSCGICTFPFTCDANSQCTSTENWCYQESANVATACGGLNSGSYTCTGPWDSTYSCANVYDTNWEGISGRAQSGASGAKLIINYNKPTNALISSKWTVKAGSPATTKYISLTSGCWNQNPLSLQLYSGDDIASDFLCWNGASWDVLDSNMEITFQEEAMWWNIGTGTYSQFLGFKNDYLNVPSVLFNDFIISANGWVSS